METDALNRRSRTAPPQPIGKRIELDESDFCLFRAIERHGALPTPLAHLSRKHLKVNYTEHVKRQTKLYNGYCLHPEHGKRDGVFPLDDEGNTIWTHTCRPITYLTRDPRQFNNHYSRENPLVHGMNDNALAALPDQHRNLHRLKRSGSFVHDLFQACFTFSFEYTAQRFRYREEIIADCRTPASTRAEKYPFHFPAGAERVYPDDIFGHEYEPGRSRFFALEIDCATESLNSNVSNSVVSTLKAYNLIFREKGYARFGLPNMSVLFATIKQSRVASYLRHVNEFIDPQYRSRFHAKSFPRFSSPWRLSDTKKEPERALLPVWDEWSTVLGEADISKKAPA